MDEIKDPHTNQLPLGKKNYILILSGVALLIIGFILLSGGSSPSPDEFNYDMFSARRIIVAPLVLLLGFGTVGFAIMKKFKN